MPNKANLNACGGWLAASSKKMENGFFRPYTLSTEKVQAPSKNFPSPFNLKLTEKSSR
jgi:hypothetical protein